MFSGIVEGMGEVVSIHSDEPDLEEVFLGLTGREL